MNMNLATAKPYAKAIFSLALQDNQLDAWQQELNELALIATECDNIGLLDNPQIKSSQLIDLLTTNTKKSPALLNFLMLLVKNKKLGLLAAIATHYQQLILTHNKTLEVKITSAHELTTAQKERILAALEKRYQQKILLHYDIDSKLIGGAIIYIQDKIIDHSIKNMLQHIKNICCLPNFFTKSRSKSL